jgi:hypothetical protein
VPGKGETVVKKTLPILAVLICGILPLAADVSSLSQVFAPGKGILDMDGDGFGEKIALSIIIPDEASPVELALAADIAARANLESLALDFDLVRKESEAAGRPGHAIPILIGSRLRWVQEIARDNRIDLKKLGSNEGRVFLFTHGGRRGIACLAGSEDALLKTGRAFFLRWPYFWEIWGRETGPTYMKLEKDLEEFLAAEDIVFQRTILREAVYDFPGRPPEGSTLDVLSFDSGEIARLVVEIHFPDEDDQKKAYRMLDILQSQRQKGQRTELLSYPGCARIDFELRHGRKSLQVSLPRMGAVKRLLTPAFRQPPRPASEREFDLRDVFTVKGVYADVENDGIPDDLVASVIIPASVPISGLPDLTTRLMLSTAGASFPTVMLDSEVRSPKSLTAPLLVGDTALTRDLVRLGRLKIPVLENAQGFVRIVPRAFGKSHALVLTAADRSALNKLLRYMGRTFPHLQKFESGQPALESVARDFESLLKGEKGGAEAYFLLQVEKLIEELKNRNLESLELRLVLPAANPDFESFLKDRMEKDLRPGAISFESASLRDGKTVFRKDKDFAWEVDDLLTAVRETIAALESVPADLKVSAGVSESPAVRREVEGRIADLLIEKGVRDPQVEVLSAYKPGFFWLHERILPLIKDKPVHRIVIRAAAVKEDRSRPKRFYSEPSRWLQELYPVDDILSRDLDVPLDRIAVEIKDAADPVYEVSVYDSRNGLILQQSFQPRLREIPYLNILPEWGSATVTTGWLTVRSGKDILLDRSLQTDLEKFWDFFQEEVIRPVNAFIQKKTQNAPTFSKQPYFKRLLVEARFSEPDFRHELDEEIVSSLEALHDEIYFDTLDFLRGITGFDPDDDDLPPDASRSSAPGNVLPMIHASREGRPGSVSVVFEDWAARTPELEVRWKETNREPAARTLAFPVLKPMKMSVPGLLYSGWRDRLESLFVEVEFEREKDYRDLIDILGSLRELSANGLTAESFAYPDLASIQARIRHKDLEKEETIPVVGVEPVSASSPLPPEPQESLVPTTEIIDPETCLEIVERLGRFPVLKTHIAGRSFEKRDIPIIEIYMPLDRYVSIPRLITFKPTLHLTARQHANEVAATNYSLKFAELIARDKAYRDTAKKINIVIQPMENPDGAALVRELHKIAPLHSLHAGRYGALGVDIGYQAGSAGDLLPEALVRPHIFRTWLPDIHLNLHGYPSHEWVQPFSNYSPFLFRDYWIPRGWFAYYRMLALPIYAPWEKAARELMGFITRDMSADERFLETNRRLTDRYRRWAERWQPHIGYLELYDGWNLYAERRSSQENRMTFRSRITFVEQTPEVMDETAVGPWLNAICEQGLIYLRAHVRYLSQARYASARIEEEVRDRIRISFHRSRPPLSDGER